MDKIREYEENFDKLSYDEVCDAWDYIALKEDRDQYPLLIKYSLRMFELSEDKTDELIKIVVSSYEENQKYKEAFDFCLKLTKVNFESPYPYEVVGVYYSVGLGVECDPQKSEQYCLEAIDRYKRFPSYTKTGLAYFTLGLLYMNANTKESLKCFQKYIKICPDRDNENYPLAHSNILTNYNYLGEFSKGVKFYRDHKDILDGILIADNNYASCLLKTGKKNNIDEAIKVFKSIVRRVNKNLVSRDIEELSVSERNDIMAYGYALSNLCAYYYSQQHNEKAVKRYLKLLEDVPVGYAMFFVGYYYSTKNDNNRAIEYFKKAIIAPLYPFFSAYNEIGAIYYEQEKYQEAKEWFNNAVKNKYFMSYLNLGLIAEKENDPELALRYYRIAADNGVNKAEEYYDALKMSLDSTNSLTYMYAEKLLKNNADFGNLSNVISNDLKEDFGIYYNKLPEECASQLAQGLYLYVCFLKLSETTNASYAPAILPLCTSLEIFLKEVVLLPYMAYLEEKLNKGTIKENELNSSFTVNIVDNKKKLDYGTYTLGGFKHYIMTKDIENNDFVFDKQFILYITNNLDLNKANLLDYLYDFVQNITRLRDIRNSAAHGDFMAQYKAEICGDDLVKVKKLMLNYLRLLK